MSFSVIQADVIGALSVMKPESFDACFTDPPYGLSSIEKRNMRRMSPRPSSRAMASGFMGMQWDAAPPTREVWESVLRLLKPGCPMLVFGSPRTFHRQVCAIEDAGFLVADTICWLHSQGFPKGAYQLKPAWEPVTLAWRPGRRRKLAIDACRIPVMEGDGRWPANVVIDGETGEMLDRQSGVLISGNNPAKRSADKHRNVYRGWKGAQCLVRRPTDSGGASRFYYCAKARGEERNENPHPTIKPLKLCEHLARLLLPRANGSLLIPYAGSGSEMVAANRAGWLHVVGIEAEPEYVRIARRRLRGEIR